MPVTKKSPAQRGHALLTKGKAALVALLGILSASAFPLWQLYFIDTPDISIEVTAISRPQTQTLEVYLDNEELMLLEPYIPETLRYEYDEAGNQGDKIAHPSFSLEVLEQAYERAKRDLKYTSTTQEDLKSHLMVIDAYLDPSNIEYSMQEFRVGTLKHWNLSSYIDDIEAQYYQQQVLKITRDYAHMHYNQENRPQIDLRALAYLLEDLKEDIHDVLTSNITRLKALRENMQGIDSQIEKLRQVQYRQYSYFVFDVIVSNMGRSSTSLRHQALTRVQLDENNYVDIMLELLDERKHAELQPSSTQLMQFRSSPLYTFPEGDRALLNTFWGTARKARLYCIDARHNIYESNPVTFIEHLSAKTLMDKLKKAASYY